METVASQRVVEVLKAKLVADRVVVIQSFQKFTLQQLWMLFQGQVMGQNIVLVFLDSEAGKEALGLVLKALVDDLQEVWLDDLDGLPDRSLSLLRVQELVNKLKLGS